jgi:hypothetical protein
VAPGCARLFVDHRFIHERVDEVGIRLGPQAAKLVSYQLSGFGPVYGHVVCIGWRSCTLEASGTRPVEAMPEAGLRFASVQ